MKLSSIVWALPFVFFSGVMMAEETPLDTSTPAPTEVPTASAQYSGPPVIKFYLSDDKYLLIQVAGLRFNEAQGFLFAGTDISAFLKELEDAGVVEFNETDDGFQININVAIDQLPGKNEFSVMYADGVKLSATIDSDKLLQDKASGDEKGFGYTRVYGRITERSGCGYYCGSTVGSSYATLHIYTLNGGWVYRGSANADSSGYFDLGLQGNNAAQILVRAVSRSGKSRDFYQYGPRCACTNASVNANMYLY